MTPIIVDNGLIPTNRAVVGEDLDSLREALGLSTMDACWLYGMSMTKWMTVVKKSPKTPVGGPTLAILARALAMWPQTCPLPKFPSADDIFAMVHEHHAQLDKKRMAIMFGCEASSGYRWLTVGSKISPALMRLFEVFRRLFEPAQKKSNAAAAEFLDRWEAMVTYEAKQRGVEEIFARGRWTQAKDGAIGRPVIGEDLDMLRERLGLSTMDACWLYGMSMTKWMTVVKRNGREPIRNVTLALLVRALDMFPDARPLPQEPTAQEIFTAVSEHKPALDKKRMAIMFGCEASSGYRWITMESKISPALARTFVVFMNRFNAVPKRSPSALQTMLNEWDRMVTLEGQARGVADVFASGRWVPKKASDTLRLRAPRAPRKAKAPAVKKAAPKAKAPKAAKKAKTTPPKGTKSTKRKARGAAAAA